MGNTCYANAVLQAIRHCRNVPFLFEKKRCATLYAKEPSAQRKKQEEVTTALAEVVTLLQACKRGQNVRPGDFWAKVRTAVAGTGFEHFAARVPHDSHEFYLFLLDTLHEATSQRVEMKLLRPPPTTDRERRCIQALETWKREFEPKYSPFVDLFYGLHHITVECTACHATTHRWETFTALKGAFPAEPSSAPLTLMDLLNEEFKPEPIADYHCDACSPTRTNAIRTVRIWRLPVYPIVVLKRFSYDGRKIGRPIAPVSTEPISFQPLFSDETTQQTTHTYSLTSIVDHHGMLHGGHYTAQAKTAAGWLIYDDQSVVPCSNGPLFGSATYMLWFERASTSSAGKSSA